MESSFPVLVGVAVFGQFAYAIMVVSAVWSYQTGRRWLAVLTRWAAGVAVVWCIFDLLDSPVTVLTKIGVAYCCWQISHRERPSLHRSVSSSKFSSDSDILDDFR